MARILPASGNLPGTPLARKGAALVIVFAVLILGLAFKNTIKVSLRNGETVQAEFTENYNLIPGKSKVKMAGLQVGLVTGVENNDSGTATVSMKVDEDALEDLGSSPSARIAPLTILGGQYAVELQRGGNGAYDGHTIPVDSTSTPVELDRVLEALPEDTRTATQGVVRATRQTLEQGGREGLRDVVRTSPEIMPPAGTFLEALQGENPGRDLATVVTDLQAFAAVLDARDSEVGAILDDLATTTGVLSGRAGDLGATVAQMPEALDATDRGMVRLHATLDHLDEAAHDLRPAVKELDPLLDELGPTLREARPVIVQLPPLLRDARAAVRQLVPTARLATGIVDDVRGPVIDRVEGPILDKLAHTWRGKDEYRNSGGGVQADNKFYEEIAYMIVNLDRASMTQDAQGSLLNFQAGFGSSSPQPIGLDELLASYAMKMGGAR